VSASATRTPPSATPTKLARYGEKPYSCTKNKAATTTQTVYNTNSTTSTTKGAVRIVRETNKPIAQVATDLGIHAGTLANWVKQDRINRGKAEGLSGDERAEPARLLAENAELRMEWEFSSDRWSCEGGDAVSLAVFIADQSTSHHVPHAVACRALTVSESCSTSGTPTNTPTPAAGEPRSTQLSRRCSRPLMGCTALHAFTPIYALPDGR
jgi:transposase